MVFEDMLPIGASVASMGVAAGFAVWVGRQQSGTESMMTFRLLSRLEQWHF
jgi:hypothetical protein